MEQFTDEELRAIWLQEAKEQESQDRRIEFEDLENEFENHNWNLN